MLIKVVLFYNANIAQKEPSVTEGSFCMKLSRKKVPRQLVFQV